MTYYRAKLKGNDGFYFERWEHHKDTDKGIWLRHLQSGMKKWMSTSRVKGRLYAHLTKDKALEDFIMRMTRYKEHLHISLSEAEHAVQSALEFMGDSSLGIPHKVKNIRRELIRSSLARKQAEKVLDGINKDLP